MEEIKNAAFISVFIASLIGSPHCVGMCGGFVALYSQHSSNNLRSHFLYNIARLITYLSLGSVAAFIGKSVNSLTELNNFSAIIVGAFLIVSGSLQLLNINMLLPKSLVLKFTGLISKFVQPIIKKGNIFTPFFIGLFTTLLPCGWLYTFISLALASSNVVDGLSIMFAFWLGTLPIMLVFGIFTKKLLAGLGGILPKISALLVIAAGIFCIDLHFKHSHHGAHPGSGSPENSHCHNSEDSMKGALGNQNSGNENLRNQDSGIKIEGSRENPGNHVEHQSDQHLHH